MDRTRTATHVFIGVTAVALQIAALLGRRAGLRDWIAVSVPLAWPDEECTCWEDEEEFTGDDGEADA